MSNVKNHVKVMMIENMLLFYYLSNMVGLSCQQYCDTCSAPSHMTHDMITCQHMTAREEARK